MKARDLDPFDALKELNDNLKKQLNEVSEENRKMELQVKRVQAHLNNLEISLNGQVYELLMVFMDWISHHHHSKVKHEESGMDGSLRNISAASQKPCSSKAELTTHVFSTFNNEEVPPCHQRLSRSKQTGTMRGLCKLSGGWEDLTAIVQAGIEWPKTVHQFEGHVDNWSDGFFEYSRNSFYMRSDLVAQKFVHESRCCVRGICGQAQDICIPSKSKWISLGIRGCSCNFPQHLDCAAQAAPQDPRQTEDSYIFMAPIATPLSAFPIPKMFMMDKSQSTLEATAPGIKAMTIPCFPHNQARKKHIYRAARPEPCGLKEE
ncbi:Coiled-coil domain-containing protein 138 [Sciurus carolinensis]|uniref:Coiled-coil domain-containing protein 138 n=1 Tax=Sciurus carolinensis TaxID=30640 RepID=A0AA41N7I1_SCICA|nr:Coiled-coil domain-containing protein 138 [Sciurus carolinensis]